MAQPAFNESQQKQARGRCRAHGDGGGGGGGGGALVSATMWVCGAAAPRIAAIYIRTHPYTPVSGESVA